MKLFYLFFIIYFLSFSGCSYASQNKDALYQVSVIQSLLEGLYDGNTTYGQLAEEGNFGIGTFNGLDGEMILLEGVFYQIRADGNVYPVNSKMKTPYASVMFFETDKSLSLNKILNYEGLKLYLDNQITSENIISAIKIEGTFEYIKTRSVSKQKKPYPRIVDVVKDQSVFEFENIEGTFVGFRAPHYLKEVLVPGYHFHFIADDKKSGGHVLECRVKNVKIDINDIHQMNLILPKNKDFFTIPLDKEIQKELEKVE